MTLSLTTVSGTFTDGTGAPHYGNVTFAPTADLTNVSGETYISSDPVTFTLNKRGFFTASLISTDNVNVLPPGWAWTCTITLGGHTASFVTSLPSSPSSADITQLMPAGFAVIKRPRLAGALSSPAVAYLPLTGGTETGTVTLAGTPPLALPSGTSGYVLASDSSGNITLQAPPAAGATLDSTASDIKALGTQSAGSGTQAARGDHVHPTTSIIAGITVSGTPAAGQSITATSSSAANWQTPAAGVTLDITASDIQALGALAAGSTGKAADAGHVHPTTSVINGVTVSGSPATGNTIVCTSGSAATWQTPAAGVTLDGTSSDIQALAGSAAAGGSGQAAKADHVHPNTGLALLAGAAFTGNVSVTGTLSATKTLTSGVVALTDASSIAVNASLGNHFRVTLHGNRTLANPTSPADGQKITVEVIQDSTGSRSLAYGTAYAFGSTVPAPTLTTIAGATDILGFLYSSAKSAWLLLAVAQDF